MARGNRFSSLPIAQFCAKAPALNTGAGRAAAMSSCFHARCAGDEKWREMYARLTDEEQAEVDAMQYPGPTSVTYLHSTLLYEDAQKEVKVGLNEFCGFALGDAALVEGTCDMYWILDRVAYVADIKRSVWTSADGPNSLQVKGYALAVCAKHEGEVDGYYTGIYAATEREWEWGDFVALDSDECLRDWQRVKAAAMNVDGDYATGPHCRSCYSRFNCPAFLVPPEHAHDGIARFFSGELDTKRVLELKLFVDRVKGTVEKADQLIKAHVEMFGPIVDEEAGKVFKPVQCNGRMSLDKKALEADHPELCQKYTKPGKPFNQYRWVNK